MIFFLIALGIRVGAILYLKSYQFPEEYEYGVIARALISGNGYSLSQFGKPPYKATSYHAPIYPLFLAFFYSFGINTLTFFFIQLTQALVCTLSGLVMYQIGKVIFNEKTAFLTFLGVIFYPPFIAYCLRIAPITLFAFFMALMVLYIFKVKAQPTLKNQFCCGALMGITALTEPNILSFLPFSLGWLFFNLRQKPWNRLKCLFSIVSVCMLILAPWTVRNYLVFQRIILVKSMVGFNLWLGNNPYATGTFYLPSGEEMQKVIPPIYGQNKSISEVEQDDILLREALSFIKNNPTKFLKLCLLKLYYYWWYPPDKLLSPEAATLGRFMKIPYGLLLLLSISGIYFAFSKIKDLSLVLLLCLSFSLIHAIFLTGHPRYRIPLEPYLILLASQAISYAVGNIVQNKELNRKQDR